MARAPLRRVLVALAAATGMAAGMSTVSAAANASGTTIHFVNQCGAEVAWFDGSSSRALADNASFATVLARGDNAAYRAGVTSDATLAEFAVDDAGTTWYDISIIPTGSLGGPGSCSSLEECKQVTGGEGFNVAMRIVPSEIAGSACETLSCLAPACDDAYQYPDEPAKTHSCGAGVEFEVIFCPDGSSSSSLSGSSSSEWVPVASDSQSGSETPLAATKSSAPSAASSTSKSAAAEATGRTTGQADSNADSNRSVVIVGVALGVVVVCVLAVALVMRHWRVIVLKWEASQWSLQRNSSPTLSFVKVDDSVQTVSSSSGR